MRTARVTATGKLRRTIRSATDDDLLPNLHDPLALQQLHRARSLPRIPLKTPLQELNPLWAQLVFRRQLRWVSLRDVIHNRPLVVQRCPGAAAGAHFEDDAAERPDVDGALAAFVLALDDFGRHVHGSAGHGLLLARDPGGGTTSGGGVVVGLEGFALAGDHFSGAKIDVFDYTVVVEENV